MTLSAEKARDAAVWGSAPFERIAHGAAPAHDALVAAMAPAAGRQWVDVATGTGAVAMRAARAGADVTALDFAAPLLATARRTAAVEHLRIEFVVGDAERLLFADASFDVVTSAQGVIFARDQRRAAAELARVCRPGGRLGLTTLVAAGVQLELMELVSRFGFPRPPPESDPFRWGDRDHVAALLGDAFTLEFGRVNAPVHASSADAAWRLYAESYGPLKTLVDALPAPVARRLAREAVALFARHGSARGVDAPRPLLLVVGERR